MWAEPASRKRRRADHMACRARVPVQRRTLGVRWAGRRPTRSYAAPFGFRDRDVACLLCTPPTLAQDAPTSSTPPNPSASSSATVRGSTVRDRSASGYLLPVQSYATLPRADASDVVAMAPGAWVSQDSGNGHAPGGRTSAASSATTGRRSHLASTVCHSTRWATWRTTVSPTSGIVIPETGAAARCDRGHTRSAPRRLRGRRVDGLSPRVTRARRVRKRHLRHVWLRADRRSVRPAQRERADIRRSRGGRMATGMAPTEASPTRTRSLKRASL